MLTEERLRRTIRQAGFDIEAERPIQNDGWAIYLTNGCVVNLYARTVHYEDRKHRTLQLQGRNTEPVRAALKKCGFVIRPAPMPLG